MEKTAEQARNYTQCDSLLIGDKCGAHTVPYIEVKNNSARVEHEATTSKVDDEQLFYLMARGIGDSEAKKLVVRGFLNEVVQKIGIAEVEQRLIETIEQELEKVGA
mgnify:CR=1 FL=1